MKVPTHIAIIMDGNGRWAKQKGLPKIIGHRQGAKAVREITETCARIGVKYLTLYAFSTENWKRSKLEISALMSLFKAAINKELKTLMDNDIRFNVVGNLSGLPKPVADELTNAEEKTKGNKGMTLNWALNYGSRAEMIEAIKSVAKEYKQDACSLDDIDEEYFGKHLYTRGMPDPDLLIRTSGEMRVSNFLLWQISYSEIYVTEKLWPDFTSKDLMQAIQDFNKRERRFGTR